MKLGELKVVNRNLLFLSSDNDLELGYWQNEAEMWISNSGDQLFEGHEYPVWWAEVSLP